MQYCTAAISQYRGFILTLAAGKRLKECGKTRWGDSRRLQTAAFVKFARGFPRSVRER